MKLPAQGMHSISAMRPRLQATVSTWQVRRKGKKMASLRLSSNSFVEPVRISREGHSTVEINLDQLTPKAVATAFSVSTIRL